MDAQQEFQRLKQAFKKREQKRQNIYIANVVDITPRENSGYIVVRLKDGTQVYAHVWFSDAIEINQVVFIIPITQESWNWFVCVGVNATTTPATVPYVMPKLAPNSLPNHTLSSHQESLDWARINTTAAKVDLLSQVQGVLPVLNQSPQIVVKTLTFTTNTIDPQSDSGISSYVLDTDVAYIKKISLVASNPQAEAKIYLYESNGSLQYETSTLPNEYTDYGGLFIIDYSGSKTLKWKIENKGAVSSAFTMYIYMINFYSSVTYLEGFVDLSSTSVIKEEGISYDIFADAVIQ